MFDAFKKNPNVQSVLYSRSGLLLLNLTLVVFVLSLLSACGSSVTVTMRSTKPTPPELVPAPQFKKSIYKKILLLPPERPVDLKGVDIKVVKDKDARYYTTKIEKALLKYGFQVISPEIVARVEQNLRTLKGTKTAAERAMIMGKKTEAHAVFMIQSLSVVGYEKYFGIFDNVVKEVEPGQVRVDEDEGLPYHAETEECLYRVPYYELRMEAKLVDTTTGNVLWVGSGRETTSDVLKNDWTGQIDSDCELVHQSFIYDDYLKKEDTLDKVASDLLGHMLVPFKNDAFLGKEIVVEKKKPAPPPKVEPPPEPEKKFAVVSSRRASLRASPSKRGDRKMYIPRKAKVEVEEVMGEWIKVKVQDGSVGWMHESTLIISE